MFSTERLYAFALFAAAGYSKVELQGFGLRPQDDAPLPETSLEDINELIRQAIERTGVHEHRRRRLMESVTERIRRGGSHATNYKKQCEQKVQEVADDVQAQCNAAIDDIQIQCEDNVNAAVDQAIDETTTQVTEEANIACESRVAAELTDAQERFELETTVRLENAQADCEAQIADVQAQMGGVPAGGVPRPIPTRANSQACDDRVQGELNDQKLFYDDKVSDLQDQLNQERQEKECTLCEECTYAAPAATLTESGASSDSEKLDQNILIGGVVGGVVGLLLLFIVLKRMLCGGRKKKAPTKLKERKTKTKTTKRRGTTAKSPPLGRGQSADGGYGRFDEERESHWMN